ncbi:MAG: SIMPL domain-containing protein [Dehalococcoidia bacterium]
MNILKVTIGVLAVAAISLLAAGCGEETTIIGGNADQAGISVSGRGEVQGEPDTGYVTVGVETTRETVAEAREEAATIANRVMESLRRNGVNREDIRTTSFAIYPRYDYRNGEQPRITGYTVTNMVEVKVRDLDAFSRIIDDAVEAGGDDVRVQGIRFDLQDREALIHQARELAMQDARAKAEQLATLGGVRLGPPLSIAEQTTASPPPFFGDRAADDAGTPIEPGLTSVVVTVSVRYGIEH